MSAPRLRTRTRPIPPPGYMFERPVLPALRHFHRELGMQDTLVNLTELALRHFEEDLSRHASPRDLVEARCKAHGINSSLGTDWPTVRRNAGLYGLAQAHGVFDRAMRRASQQYRRYKAVLPAAWVHRDGQDRQLDPLTALTANLPRGLLRAARAAPEYALAHFFRAVRNAVLHSDDENPDLEAERDKLIAAHGPHLLSCYGRVPARYGDEPYPDFILLTRALKNYVQLLSNLCNLTADEIVRYRMGIPAFLARARRCKGQPQKLAGLAAGLRSEYLLDDETTAEVEERMGRLLAVDPNQKARRAKGRGLAPRGQ